MKNVRRIVLFVLILFFVFLMSIQLQSPIGIVTAQSDPQLFAGIHAEFTVISTLNDEDKSYNAPTLNDNGDVAWVSTSKRSSNEQNDLFVFLQEDDTSSSVELRSTGAFDPNIQINNLRNIVVRVAQNSFITRIQLLNAQAPEFIATGDSRGGDFADFQGVFAFPSVNNKNKVVFNAENHPNPTQLFRCFAPCSAMPYIGSALFPYLTFRPNSEIRYEITDSVDRSRDEFECNHRCLVRPSEEGDFQELDLERAFGIIPEPLRPKLADTGEVLTRVNFESEGEPEFAYLLFKESLLSSPRRIADTLVDFDELGRTPGISDDGRVIVFYGDLTEQGASTHQLNPGPGIFLAVRGSITEDNESLTDGWQYVRIAGISENGFQDNGDIWTDQNGNSIVDNDEDKGEFREFLSDEPINVNVAPISINGEIQYQVLVAFIAENVSGNKGLYTVQMTIDKGITRLDPGLPDQIITTGRSLVDSELTDYGTIDDISLYDGVNANNQLAFAVELQDGTDAIVRANAVRRPVFVVPGIAGTMGIDFNDWLLNRGIYPEALVIDPLGQFYNNIIASLEQIGYTKNIIGSTEFADLWVANYDWRMPIGPKDGMIDGFIDGVSFPDDVATIDYQYGVDYLVYWLSQAALVWQNKYPSTPLPSVDIISHSTGGLVSRSYIQSNIYNQEVPSTDYSLPQIYNLIMVGVSNRGASKAWNPLHDNWISDPIYRILLSKFVGAAYKQVTTLNNVITGPDYDISNDSLDANDPKRFFIHQYVPAIRGLLATYPFIVDNDDVLDVNDVEEERNELLLDLNSGLDLYETPLPNIFSFSSNVAHAIVVYNDAVDTVSMIETRLGDEDVDLDIYCTIPTSKVDAIGKVIEILTGQYSGGTLSFTEYCPSIPDENEVWYIDILDPRTRSGGDGTVPLRSSAGLFIGDDRFEFFNQPGEEVSHTALMYSKPEMTYMFEKLGNSIDDPANQLVTDQSRWQQLLNFLDVGGKSALYTLYLDPVDGYIVDSQGRRLGYTSETGALSEIPDSIWLGDNHGIGWALIEIGEPVNLKLIGLGEEYAVELTIDEGGRRGGLDQSGFLADGEELEIIISTDVVALPNVTICDGDINEDGVLDIIDSLLIQAAWNSIDGDTGWIPELDINTDNTINIFDVDLLTELCASQPEDPTSTATSTPEPIIVSPSATLAATTSSSSPENTLTPEPATSTPLPDITSVPITQLPILQETLTKGIVSSVVDKTYGLNRIEALAYSPSGETVLIGGSSGIALILEVNSGIIQQILVGHRDSVTSVTFSPDGTLAATGSRDSTVRLWDVETGRLINILPHTTGRKNFFVTSVEFSPDGSRIGVGTGPFALVGEPDYVAWMWDIEGNLLRVFEGHTSDITAVDFSPDGKLFTTASRDQSIKLWQADTGNLVRTLTGHTALVSSLDFSSDSTQLVSGSWDTTIRVWDLTNGVPSILQGHTTEVNTVKFVSNTTEIISGSNNGSLRRWDVETAQTISMYKEHDDAILTTGVSPNGSQFLSGSEDGTIRLWDITALDYLISYSFGHTDRITSLDISNDGNYLLSGSWDTTAKLWDAKTGTSLQTFVGASKFVTAVSLSSDNTIAAVGSQDGIIRLYDTTDGSINQTLESDGVNLRVTDLAFSPDGAQIVGAFGAPDNIARIWNLNNGELINTFDLHSSDILSIAYSNDGNRIATGSADNSIIVWDAQSTDIISQGGVGQVAFTSVVFSPDGNTLIAGASDGNAYLFDANNGLQLQTYPISVQGRLSVAFSPDGKYVIGGSDVDRIRIFDLTSATLITNIDYPATDIKISPDGNDIYGGGKRLDNVIRRWHFSTTVEDGRFTQHTKSIQSGDISADSNLVATGGCDRRAFVWSSKTQELLREIAVSGDCVVDIEISNDGLLLGLSDGATGQIWDLQTNIRLFNLRGHNSTTTSIAFSSDGLYIVTGGEDRELSQCLKECGSAKLWDAHTGELRRTFTHNGRVHDVAISPDNSLIATAADDDVIRIWNLQDGELLGTLSGHVADVLTTSFSPSGQYVVSGSADQYAIIWEVNSSNIVRVIEHPSAVTSAKFSPDGDAIVTSSGETAYVWDLSDGHLLTSVGHSGSVQMSDISSNNLLLTVGDDAVARLWFLSR